MVGLIVAEALTALMAGIASFLYWQQPTPGRKLAAGVLLTACAAVAFVTAYWGSPFHRRTRMTAEQREQLWLGLATQYGREGAYVGEHYPDARVLLLVPAGNVIDPNGSRAVAAFQDGAGGRIANVVVETCSSPVLFLYQGESDTPEDATMRQDAVKQFDDLLDRHPETTVVVDQVGLCLGFAPFQSRWHGDESRPKLVLGMCLMDADAEEPLRSGWLEAAAVISPLPPPLDPVSGEPLTDMETCILRADELDDFRRRAAAEMLPVPVAMTSMIESPAVGRGGKSLPPLLPGDAFPGRGAKQTP